MLYGAGGILLGDLAAVLHIKHDWMGCVLCKCNRLYGIQLFVKL